MYQARIDVDNVNLNGKEYFKTLNYYLLEQLPLRGRMDLWSIKDTNGFIRLLLDNVYKQPIYSTGLIHSIDLFHFLDEPELVLAVKLCMLMDIGGSGFVDCLNERSILRSSTESSIPYFSPCCSS